MGIIKIRHQGPSKDNNVLHCPLKLDEFVQEESLQPAKDHSHELDDSEPSDTGCEYASVNDQICNVPYELYELPNLKEILSLKTWNSYLTEEERFHLTAYLPDMDQETFELTMLDLLGSANLFFGSPLELLFRRLKGGFYSLQVSHFRERLKFLYERRYYHSLRSYHERMGQKIVDMRKAWINCQPNISVEERVQIINNKKSQKPVFLVDLNAFPADEELSSKADKKVMGLPQLKKPRCINEEVSNSRKKAKGVLKRKILDMNTASKQAGLQLHKESQEPFRRAPKGILKIKPKGHPTSLVERPMVVSILPDWSSDSVFGVQPVKLSPVRFASQWQGQAINRRLRYLHQSVRDGSVNRGSITPDLTNGQQSEDALNISSGLFENAHSSLRKKKTVKSMKMYSNGMSDVSKCFDDQQTRVLSTSSSGLYQSAPDIHTAKAQVYTSNNTDVSKAVSRNSTSVMDDYQMFPNYLDRSEHLCRYKYDGEGVERSRIFPITYKRKKSSTEQNLKQPSMVASMELGAPTAVDFHQVEKAKSIKIRVKGWNEFTY